MKRVVKATSRENHEKSEGLAALTLAFFYDFNADIALNATFKHRESS